MPIGNTCNIGKIMVYAILSPPTWPMQCLKGNKQEETYQKINRPFIQPPVERSSGWQNIIRTKRKFAKESIYHFVLHVLVLTRINRTIFFIQRRAARYVTTARHDGLPTITKKGNQTCYVLQKWQKHVWKYISWISEEAICAKE